MVGFRSSSRRRCGTSSGFSLVELLVVVAIAAILTGLLLPAMSSARKSARQLACAAMQRQIMIGLLDYTAHNDEWIPGANTSGNSLWPIPSQPAIDALNRWGHAPVQVNDWLSPSLSGERLPANRQERFYALLERFACPDMELRSPVWLGGDRGALDMAEWVEAHAPQPVRGISYLMPAVFQLYGGPRIDPLVTQHSTAKLAETGRIHILRRDYRPRLDSIGSVSKKIAFADAFRFLDPRTIDFDASYSHANWGAFTERSACDVLSRSWGRNGGGGTGLNLPIVYRHLNRMNAAFWDGHAEPLSRKSSRNPVLWAPSRSTLQLNPALDEDSKAYGYSDQDPARRVIE